MNKRIKAVTLFTLFIMVLGVGTGCGQSPAAEQVDMHDPASATPASQEEDTIDISLEMIPLTELPAVFAIPMPTAPGASVKKNEKALIDYSNIKDGYVMVKYLQKTGKAIRIIIKGPETSYTYALKSNGDYEVYPLSDGNGSYQITVYENIEGSKYATANTAAVEVKLKDEFAPFVRPNQYVNYNKDSKTVKKAAEITKNAKNLTEQITAIYNYTIKNITYDKQLAATVQSGYLPDVDKVLKNGKGICFDYAAVTTAMLRSQGIPTKLVVGYAGDVYHAWISAYSKETGWINGAIYFDGKNWKLMDPTFASSGSQSSEIMKYIGDGNNYTAKYLY